MLHKKLTILIVTLSLIASLFPLLDFTTSTVSGTAVTGDQGGVWDAFGSPYIVTGNVTVPSYSALDIRPGVTVKFNADSRLIVKGILYANGTLGGPITFTSNLGTPYIGSWDGVIFNLVGVGKLENCTITYAKRGLWGSSCTKIRVRNCNIYNCETGIRLYQVSNSTIENSKIHDNTEYGILSFYFSGLITIRGNSVYNNPTGIRLVTTSKSTVENNHVYKNFRGITWKFSRDSTVINNIIENTKPLSRGLSRSVRARDEWEDDDDWDDYNDFDDEEVDYDFDVNMNCGLYINGSRYFTVEKNKISNTSGFGIILYRAYYNYFENNNVINSTDKGIFLSRSCGYNLFKNNSIIYPRQSAIALHSYSNNNIFVNNTITKFSNKNGIEYVKESLWNSFSPDNLVNNTPLRIFMSVPGKNITRDLANLIITEPFITNLGQVLIIDCTNFTVFGGTYSDGRRGLFFYNSQNISLGNLTIASNYEYGIYFGYNSTNITFINSSISGSAKKDLYLEENTNITLVNTTFDKTKVVYSKSSNLTIQWYLHVKALYAPTLDILPGVTVQVYDVFNNREFLGTTNDFGEVNFIRCTEAIISDKATLSSTPHNVSGIKMHHQPDYAGSGVLIDGTKWVTLQLTDNLPPGLSGPIYPVITHNRNPTIKWSSGEDPDNDVLLYWLKLWNEHDQDVILEQGSTYEKYLTVQINLTYGERYWVSINASDPYGGWSEDNIGNFDVINRAPSAPSILLLPLQDNLLNKPSKNEDLNCSVEVDSLDIDDNPKDQIKYNFNWYKDGTLQEDLSVWNSTKDHSVLSKEFTTTGDEWTCEVTATDGFAESASVSESRIILNSPPTVVSPVTALELLEDTIDYGTIDLSKIFGDDDNEPLQYGYDINGENITIDIQNDGKVFVIPRSDWSGVEQVVFTASDEEVSVHFKTTITVIPVHDPPYVDILLPVNNSNFLYSESLGINFLGVFDDADIAYGDVIDLTWSYNDDNISIIIGNTSELNHVVLPVGNHTIDFVARDSADQVAKDSVSIQVISIDVLPPKVPQLELLSPLPGQIKNTTTVELSWNVVNLNFTEAEGILFDIYFDTITPPRHRLTSEYLGTNITIPSLVENTTYYWWVIPYFKNYQGLCLSGIWNFTIDLGFKYTFGLELVMPEPELIIYTGEVTTFNFTLKNTGNIVNKFHVSLAFLNNSELLDLTTLEFSNITLQSEELIRINLTFNVSKNHTLTNLNDLIIVTATSLLGAKSANVSRNLTLINTKVIIPEAAEEETDELPLELLRMLLLTILVIIIILILILIFLGMLLSSLKNREKLNRPLKQTVIVRKERSMLTDDASASGGVME